VAKVYWWEGDDDQCLMGSQLGWCDPVEWKGREAGIKIIRLDSKGRVYGRSEGGIFWSRLSVDWLQCVCLSVCLGAWRVDLSPTFKRGVWRRCQCATPFTSCHHHQH
jgi:hypothetical protein